MRKILEVTLAAIATLMTIVPIVAPATAPVTASASVAPMCDIQANPTSISFGTNLIPGTTVDGTGQDVAASQVVGNVNTVLTIYGIAWTGGTGMSVDQTHWSKTATTYSSMTTLKLLANADTINPSLTPTGSDTVHFGLMIPAHQAAAQYTQTITFQVSC